MPPAMPMPALPLGVMWMKVIEEPLLFSNVIVMRMRYDYVSLIFSS